MLILQQLINGFTTGCLYALTAYSYSLIFGILGIIFFAQGELIMIAPFFALTVTLFLGNIISPEMAVICGLLAALFLTILVGGLTEKIALKPLREAPRVKSLISSLGISIILQSCVMLIWGRHNLNFIEELRVPSIFKLTELIITDIQIAIIGTSLSIFLGLDYFFRHSKYGLAIRAVSQDKLGASLMGIKLDKTIMITFVITSSLAFITGILMASYSGVIKFDMGFTLGVKGLLVAIVGGSGNLRGAFIIGIMLGISEAIFSGYFSSDYKDIFAFSILILILLIKPTGLFKEDIRKG